MSVPTTSGNARRDDLVCVIHAEYHEALLFHAKGVCKRFGFDPSFANDLLQEVYMKVLLRPELIQEGLDKSGPSYLFTMIKRNCINLQRKGKSLDRLKEVFDHEAPRIADINHLCIQIHAENFLEDLQACLSEQDFEIMRRYINGYTYQEIGQEIGMNSSTVGVRIHRSRKMLVKHLA